MAKFSKKTVEKIVGLVKSDTYTIAEICRQVGITPKTYHQWVNDYPDFADAIEQAKDERMQMMVIEAKKSLMKKMKRKKLSSVKRGKSLLTREAESLSVTKRLKYLCLNPQGKSSTHASVFFLCLLLLQRTF